VYTSWTSGTISIKGCKVQKANVQFECLRSIKKQAARNSYSLEASLKRKAGAKKRDQYLQLIEQDSSKFHRIFVCFKKHYMLGKKWNLPNIHKTLWYQALLSDPVHKST